MLSSKDAESGHIKIDGESRSWLRVQTQWLTVHEDTRGNRRGDCQLVGHCTLPPCDQVVGDHYFEILYGSSIHKCVKRDSLKHENSGGWQEWL